MNFDPKAQARALILKLGAGYLGDAEDLLVGIVEGRYAVTKAMQSPTDAAAAHLARHAALGAKAE